MPCRARAWRRASDEGVVAARVKRELAVLEMQNELRHGIEQIAVVADDEDAAAIALEIILEPQHAFEIEIVCRLVEQQQVGRGEQNPRERHAHAPAAGEFGAGTLLLGRRKAEAGQDRGRTRGRRIGVDRFKAGVNIAELVGIGLGFGLCQQVHPLRFGFEHGLKQCSSSRRELPAQPCRCANWSAWRFHRHQDATRPGSA
jgi:hypothetical protein